MIESDDYYSYDPAEAFGMEVLVSQNTVNADYFYPDQINYRQLAKEPLYSMSHNVDTEEVTVYQPKSYAGPLGGLLVAATIFFSAIKLNKVNNEFKNAPTQQAAVTESWQTPVTDVQYTIVPAPVPTPNSIPQMPTPENL